MKTSRQAVRKRAAPKLPLPRRHDAAEWEKAIRELPDDVVSRPQKLQFLLMLGSAFNKFRPFAVVRDLLRHRALWRGAVMDRGYTIVEGTHTDLCRLSSDLIHLRDIGTGVWNVDTLFVLTDAASEPRWRPILEGWGAAEVNFLDAAESGQLLGAFGPMGDLKVMTVWWE